MNLRFADSVPVEHRRWIRGVVRRCLKAWHLADEWDIHIVARRLTGGDRAMVCYEETAHEAEIVLDTDRLTDRSLLRADIVHEVLHLLDDELRGLLGLASCAPVTVGKRRMSRARIDAIYEAHHDRMARLWNEVLFK